MNEILEREGFRYGPLQCTYHFDERKQNRFL